MRTMGPAKRLPAKEELKVEICEYCDHVRCRIIDGTSKLVCAEKSPADSQESMQAYWPIVEPEESCGDFKFNHG